MTPRLLRSAAILIAVLGVVDPSITLTRPLPAVVAVVDTAAAAAETGDLADRVARTLDGPFTVVRHAFPGAAAVVAVGDRPPDGVESDGVPGIAVVREAARPLVEIASVTAPARAPLESRASIDAAVHVAGAKGHRVEVTLASGDLVVDRLTRDVATDEERFEAALTLVPATEGLAALRVTARDVNVPSARADADLAIEIRRQPWSVLVFDGHPSWASTFVRRALEHDVRFSVTTRVDTSQDASTNIGQPPSSLASLDALLPFDAIVVGAPDDATPADIAGLEAFARRRAGAVVMILDKTPAPKFDRLLRVSRWTAFTSGAAVAIDASSPIAARLMSSEFVWPEVLPPGAETLATAPVGGARHTVVWRMPLGAGRVIVTGALDAWRSRAAAASTFDEYWRTIVGDAAQASPPPLDVTIEPALAAPGGSSAVRVAMRDLALGAASGSPAREAHAAIDARLEGPGGSTIVRLWPDDEPGRWRGAVRAAAPGAYRLVVTSGALTASAPLRVSASVARSEPDGRDFLRAWAASRRGSSLEDSRLAEIRDVVSRAIEPTSARQVWRPLRSPWWIMPFAVLLGGEWWWRRRRGLL